MVFKKNKFPERLKEVRHDNNMSQRELAKVLGFSQATIAMWETGDRDPSTTELGRVCQILNADANYLLGLVD